MPYLHGVYTSESPTSVVPTVDAASCLPFVIGTAPEGYTGDSLVRCRNWQEFKAAFGAAESYEGADPSTLAAFARQWYKRAGAGDALFFVASGEGGGDAGTPLAEFDGCSFGSSEDYYGSIPVLDSNNEAIPAVEGAAFYTSPTYPSMYFWVEDGYVRTSNYVGVFTEPFFLEAYAAAPRVVGSINGCSASTELLGDYGNVVVDANGEIVHPIDGAETYKTISISGKHYAIINDTYGGTDTYDGNDCLSIISEGLDESDVFTVEGLALGGSSGGSIADALAALDTVYERFGLVVTVVLCPRTGIESASEIAAKVQKFGSGWSAIGLIDLPYNWGNAAPDLPLKSSYLVYCSPRCQAGSEIVDASSVVAGAMAATDASAGGFPYVSPSNKLAYIEGIVDEEGQPLFLSQPDVNDLFNANAVVSFLHNAKGWVVWGNNTGYYSPSATDPKDRWISVRRTFCYIRNDFLVFGASRIDNPINKRQLDGVVNAYNQRLKGLVGVGAVNSASIALSDRNTAETLLGGAVFVDVRISPPPPMENLDATFEYDVEGFVSSLS